MGLTNFPEGISVDGYKIATTATITVGTEATNAIAVTVQLKDGNGDNIDAISGFQWYLSGDSAGAGIVGTAPTGGVAAGASGTPTFYLVVILPTGKTVISSAITFA